MNIYRHAFFSVCLHNGKRIRYLLELRTPDVVMVENLVEACAAFALQPSLHEDIADQLYQKFGGTQMIVAHHHGVDLETRRGE